MFYYQNHINCINVISFKKKRLARVYVSTAADVKRTIIRLLEQPVRGMGMNSPELLLLVEQCPKGAETLVTRVIHVLTDKG